MGEERNDEQSSCATGRLTTSLPKVHAWVSFNKTTTVTTRRRGGCYNATTIAPFLVLQGPL